MKRHKKITALILSLLVLFSCLMPCAFASGIDKSEKKESIWGTIKITHKDRNNDNILNEGESLSANTSELPGKIDEDYTVIWLRNGIKVLQGRQYTARRLDLGARITCRAEACGENYTGFINAGERFDVPPSVPVAPNVTYVAYDDKITLKWNAPFSTGSKITGYTVRCDAGTNVTTSKSITITGLLPNTEYKFMVAAQNDLGSSKERIVEASTLPAGVKTFESHESSLPVALAEIDIKSAMLDKTSLSEASYDNIIEAAYKAVDTVSDACPDSQVKLNLETGAVASASLITLPTEAFSVFSDGGLSKLTFSSRIGEMTLYNSAQKSVLSKAKSDKLGFLYGKSDASKYSREQREAVSNAAAWDVSITSGSTQLESLGDGVMNISFPYILKEDEAAEKLAVYLVKKDGAKIAQNAYYDAKNRNVVFETNTTGTFMLAFDSEAFVESKDALFLDVALDSLYYDAINYVAEKEIMSGTSKNTFSPDEYVTRAMAVTILWRMGGSEDIKDEVVFLDVPSGAYYAKAVSWGVEEGLISGITWKDFKPDDNITREQLAAMMYRFAKAQKPEISVAIYNDYNTVSSWALDAVNWAVNENIMSGSEGGLLPKGYATRAQFAAMIMRLDIKLGKSK